MGDCWSDLGAQWHKRIVKSVLYAANAVTDPWQPAAGGDGDALPISRWLEGKWGWRR